MRGWGYEGRVAKRVVMTQGRGGRRGTSQREKDVEGMLRGGEAKRMEVRESRC